MKSEDKHRLLATVAHLRKGGSELVPREVERLLMEVLHPLLAEDGYELIRTSSGRDEGMDFVAKRPPSVGHQGQTLGIQFKYYRLGRPVGVDQVRSLIGAALLRGIDRAVLLVNTKFTEAARHVIQREMPLEIELVDLDSLRAWIDRLEVDQTAVGAEIRGILSDVSRRFAAMIAVNPRSLDQLEWRDVERILAEVFEGLGFSATLTPPSKDGGKDVVLECIVQGRRAEYIVEVKHWPSGSRVGGNALRSFLNVIVREARKGGLFLSTYGYCENAFEQLSAIDRSVLRFGSEQKIVALCRTYVKAASGLWSPPENLAEVLFEETI